MPYDTPYVYDPRRGAGPSYSQDRRWAAEEEQPDVEQAYTWRTTDASQWAAAQRAYQESARSRYADVVSGRSSVGLAAQSAGLAGAGRQMMAQGVGRGDAGLAVRRAQLAGVAMNQQAMQQAAAQRMQEVQAARTAYARAQSAGVSGELMQQQLYGRQQIAAAQNWAQMSGAEAGEDVAQREWGQRIQAATVEAAAKAATMGASDIRAKRNIVAPSAAEQDAAMRAMQAYRYRYRQGGAAVAGIPPDIRGARRAGVMAQDLERSPLTAPLVERDATGLRRVDTGQAGTLALGLTGRLTDRADELDARLAQLEAQRPARSSGRV